MRGFESQIQKVGVPGILKRILKYIKSAGTNHVKGTLVKLLKCNK